MGALSLGGVVVGGALSPGGVVVGGALSPGPGGVVVGSSIMISWSAVHSRPPQLSQQLLLHS